MTWKQGGHNGWFSVTNDEPDFAVKFNSRASKLYQDFEEAANDAVNKLYNDWNTKPLYLALSGGLDSELIANALLRNHIPFTPVILKIEQVNEFESWYADYWCYKNNIKPLVLNYTFKDYSDAAVKFYKKLCELKTLVQVPILILYDYVNQHNGHMIYGAADMNPEGHRFYCYSLDFISDIIDIGKHPTSFFMYTPELALSYVYQFDMSQDEQYNKLCFYNVGARPKIDFIGNLIKVPEIRKTIDKLSYIAKYDQKKFNTRFWYGTKEQIIQSLSP